MPPVSLLMKYVLLEKSNSTAHKGESRTRGGIFTCETCGEAYSQAAFIKHLLAKSEQYVQRKTFMVFE